jgi:hypothetical protein
MISSGAPQAQENGYMLGPWRAFAIFWHRIPKPFVRVLSRFCGPISQRIEAAPASYRPSGMLPNVASSIMFEDETALRHRPEDRAAVTYFRREAKCIRDGEAAGQPPRPS